MITDKNVYAYKGKKVFYKFRPSMDDRKHLIVIFSGFRSFGSYDFGGNTTSMLKSNILWIEDRFDNSFAYYMCLQGESWVEDAVHSLISGVQSELFLTNDETSVAGFSKGGSAALYYGLKYGYKNVLATVPQLRIGTYVKNNWPKVLAAMVKHNTEAGTAALDDILPALIRKSKFKRRVNIYLFSSMEDKDHKVQVGPYLRLLNKYRYFNYVLTSSPMVKEHDKVTRYNVPMILSLFGMFGENVSPRIGSVGNGLDSMRDGILESSPVSSNRSTDVMHNIDRVSIIGDRLLLDGFAFVRGYAASKYGVVHTSFIMRNADCEYKVQLGTVASRDLSYNHYEDKYTDYSHAGFTTFDRRGINLEGISNGRYAISVAVSHGDIKSEVEAKTSRSQNIWAASNESLFNFSSTVDNASLVKRPVLGRGSSDAHVTLDKSWMNGSILHLEGYFIVPGVSATSYATTGFYLILVDPKTDEARFTLNLAVGNRARSGELIADVWTDYSKAYYATPKYSGIDLTGVTPGNYDCWITARFDGSIFSSRIPLSVKVGIQYPDMVSGVLPSVGVIGSCVSRDNFNSRIVSDWKKFFEFHGSQYQMSLVSLLSPPVEIDDETFSDADAHTASTTLRDFRKSYLNELKISQPDILVIDFFADARFGCVEIADSLVTNNEWKLHKTDFYRGENLGSAHSMALDSDDYLSLFVESALKFEAFRKAFLPDTVVVLNSARATSSRIDKGQRVLMSPSVNAALNDRWTSLDEAFLRHVEVASVISMPIPLQGDSNHPWGAGPVHYEKRFYDHFRKTILKSLSSSIYLE